MKKYLSAILVLIFMTPIMSNAAEVTVSWDTPTQRENGDALPITEIGGYEIVAQQEGSTSSNSYIVPQATATSMLLNLGEGTWRVQVATYDTEGLYSEYSDPAFKVIGNAPAKLNPPSLNSSYGSGGSSPCGSRENCVVLE